MYKAGGIHDLDGWNSEEMYSEYKFQPGGIPAGVGRCIKAGENMEIRARP